MLMLSRQGNTKETPRMKMNVLEGKGTL